LNNKGDEINESRTINIQFSSLNKNEKIKIINIFNKYLKDYYEWNGLNMSEMKIHYEKIKNNKLIDISKLKDNDVYPQLYINIIIKNNIKLDNEIFDILVKYFENLREKHFVTYEYGIRDFMANIYSFEKNMKIINNMKKFFETQPNIKSFKIYFNDGKNEELV
jgi:hypothetical protein